MEAYNLIADAVLQSVVTCPQCGRAKEETMPTDAGQWYYECAGCHVPARWILAATAANVVSMQLLLRLYGTGRHLSLPHVVFWTPLLIYLFLRRNSLLARSPFGVWCVLLFLTDLASLVLDYAAVVKLLLR